MNAPTPPPDARRSAPSRPARSSLLCTLISVLCSLLSAPAAAQSLYLREPAPPSQPGERVDPAEPLYDVSLIAVRVPKPKTYQRHDQITIIINEVSQQKTDQKLDTEKDAKIRAELNQVFDVLRAFRDFDLRQSSTQNIDLVDARAEREFKGDGRSARSDRLTDRITATVLDVKPNGILVLEAKRVLQNDRDVKTVLLSGSCRADDVTRQGTVQSYQLADLSITVQHEGPIAEAARKGWLTRLVEAAFPF